VVVLDTHAWIWFTDAPDRLSPPARRAIDDAGAVGVSAVSIYELAQLVARRRISLTLPVRTWAERALAAEMVHPLPVTPPVAMAAALLGRDYPPDPFDRMILATARGRGAALVTADGALRAADPAGTVW
jgi:PIN domain nuclease of toxin-antitoxin system